MIKLMKKNGGFVHLALIFVVVFAALVAFVLLRNTYDAPNDLLPQVELKTTETQPEPTLIVEESQSTDTQPEPTSNDEWNIPKLPSGFDWQTKRLDKDEARDYQMYSSLSEVRFPTTVNFVDLDYEDSKETIDYWEILKVFSNEMVNNGWSYDVNYEDKRITGMAADGVFGSIYGNVKVKGDQIRSIGYSYNLKPASWEGPGSEALCPCELHLEIYIGDVVGLKDI